MKPNRMTRILAGLFAILLIVGNGRAGVLEDFFAGFGNFPVL